MPLDFAGETLQVIGADALRAVTYPGTQLAAYKALNRGLREGARVLRNTVKKKNFVWDDKSGALRRSVRVAKSRGRTVREGGRSTRALTYATVVVGDYRPSSKAYSPHAHLVVRGYKTRSGKTVPGLFPIQVALEQDFSKILSVINRDYYPDLTKELEREVRRAYRGSIRNQLKNELRR